MKDNKLTDDVLNMKDKELQQLASYIAKSLIELGQETSSEDWAVTDQQDHLIGELARCMTLQNMYLEREEFEKCAIMKVRIDEINNKLGFKNDDEA